MNASYVWTKIFPIGRSSSVGEKCVCMENICTWICRAHKENVLSRCETGNLMTRVRKDYSEPAGWEWWYFLSRSLNYEDFCSNVPTYMKCRAEFPSRDKVALDPACFPWSNEKMYGKGINSRVRECI